MAFKKVHSKQSFPELEEEILKFWKEENIFQKSIDIRNNCNEFNFYDGPPFATGLPHYGHILAGTIKDVIPRYQTMLGKKVERKFGWDCHGLPIEGIVEKKLNIKSKKDIDEKIGVYKFNELCRENVLTYTSEWKKFVDRMGRWVDMENDYKTMDVPFMESVWWVFKELYNKGLIYQDYRVVPYSVGMSTPLSNFEVNQNYKEKQDKAITVKFKIIGEENKYFLAWTTTPWTLVANLGLAVGKDIEYVELKDLEKNQIYILAKSRISDYYKNDSDYEILKSFTGEKLEGFRYENLYNDFLKLSKSGLLPIGQKITKNSYSVVIGDHVTDSDGTGIVHTAPAYGEDDMIIGKKYDLGFVSHINDDGYTQYLEENNGVWVFDFNELAINKMKEKGLVLKIGTIVHSYPYCWRTDIPLIYRAISAWYVNVVKIKDKILSANEKINWVPESIKYGRFGKWLEGARDWNISRNRYWGSAIPIWQSEDKKHEWCVGSVEELYNLNKDFGQIKKVRDKYYYTDTGKEIDLHKHFVDNIKIKHPESSVELKRIKEVLDCWFESGSMPYASKHYPFEDKKHFKFPADFIAEGTDQTRGWFYTLVVLSAALFDKNPFSNVIVNGIVLTEEGKKMSKRLQNYTDPTLLINRNGADAMRFYLMNSPAVEANDLRFADSGVEEVVKKVILPLWNTYSFFTTYANIDNFTPDSSNIYYLRHGETDNNKNGIVNGGDDDVPLNEYGTQDIENLGKTIASSDLKFDIIISSPLKRAIQTSEIIKKHLHDDIEIIECEDFKEQSYGEFRGKSFDELRKKYNCKTNGDLTRIYRNNKEEPLKQFEERVTNGYKNIIEKYKGKNILIVSHGGVFRPINKYLNNLDDQTVYYGVRGIKNGVLYKLPNYTKSNPLDKWIVSEFNKLVLDVRNGLDNYKLNYPTKYIFKFIDNLTNWYIRRSRKRFWKNETDSDKLEAYNTLYDILVELTKIIAPYMPFISEYIYKNLTNKKSVHLELYPESNSGFIYKNLNKNTEEVRNIITLGLSARANAKMRVRQPLSYVKITNNIDSYFQDIIKEELNIKEVRVFSDNEIPLQICKPNARRIGPKYGAGVKFIIKEAKEGNFKLLENGSVQVGEYILEPSEFELEYVRSNDNKNLKESIESSFGIVIALGIEITEELKLEGYARDIVRYIQESRKEANYNVEDRILVGIHGDNIGEILKNYKNYIETETLSKITTDTIDNYDLNKEISVEDMKFTLFLKK